jgi:hypothetical protein
VTRETDWGDGGTGSPEIGLALEKQIEGRDERWKVSGQDLPEHVQVDRVIAVDQAVPQGDDLLPRKPRMALLQNGRDAVRVFADDLKELPTGKERGPDLRRGLSTGGLL